MQILTHVFSGAMIKAYSHVKMGQKYIFVYFKVNCVLD